MTALRVETLLRPNPAEVLARTIANPAARDAELRLRDFLEAPDR